jgi:hypothetical protein
MHETLIVEGEFIFMLNPFGVVIVMIVEIRWLKWPGKAVALETREPHDLFPVAP